MYRILLIEDDLALAEAMKAQLSVYDHEVICVRNFSDILTEFSEAKPDLVLMDIMLPSRDGYFWCTQIRKVSKVPVIFVSSASENMNIVMAINMGGDDFIAKPVDPMVLCAKVNAVLRRTYEINVEKDVLTFSGAELHLSEHIVTFEDHKVELTRNEMRILTALLEDKGRIVSRETLMMKLWQDDLYVEENTLTVNVARLRKKLEECGMKDVIQTKPGSGYMVP